MIEKPGPGWQEAVEHMAELIRKDIDEEILQNITEEIKNLENLDIHQTKLCSHCKNGTMNLYGVTESGAYKYICSSCYHKAEFLMSEDGVKSHRHCKLDTWMKKIRERVHV